MSERGKRVFRFLLDQERDADVIGRVEAQPSMTGYVRELVRRDVHDERLDFAALKASELQAENAKLRELARDAYATLLFYVGKYNEAEASLCAEYGEDDAIAKLDRECDNDVMLLERRMKLIGIEVKQ